MRSHWYDRFQGEVFAAPSRNQSLRLIEKARAGEEVIIIRGKQRVAKLVAIQAPELKDRVPGSLKGKILCAPNAFDPLTQQELSDLGFE